MNAQLSYLSKCVRTAQRMLMLPHPKGEAHDIASAMSEILQGLHGCNINDINDDNGRRCLKRIQNAMDVIGLEDADDKGLYFVKAKSMDIDERADFSHAVSELSSSLHREA